MKKLFFLVGASGSGKTTAAKELEKQCIPHLKILYFDSIGVPSMEGMEKEHGGPEEWQKAKTNEWVQIIKRDFLPNTHILFDGQTRPSFIEEACYENEVKDFKVILFDCSDSERERRLAARGQQNLADENMMNWARFLRRECRDRECLIIDNTTMQIKEMSAKLLSLLHSFMI